MLMLAFQIRDIAVALRLGLTVGRVKRDAPAPAPEHEAPAVRKNPVGFQPNDPSSPEE